jgi:hypothetical protein
MATSLRPRPSLLAVAGPASLFVLALLVGTELSRPDRSASIAFDSQMAVLHFDRILAGRHLESFIATTPKPLLTVMFGLLHAVSGGWAAIAWATVVAHAVAVVLASVLARRLGGPVAGAFSGLAVLASPGLLFDVGFALATPWAAIGWFGAGLAVTADRPRYAVAGLALMLATLARLETLVVVVIVAFGLAACWLANWQMPTLIPKPPTRAWLVPAIALCCLPIMMLHDALLTGDPLFWTTVAGQYSTAHAALVRPPTEVVAFLIDRYSGAKAFLALTLLALLGLARIGRRRSWSVLVGLLAFGPGIGLLLVTLAARGIFVSDRYAASIDAAVAFAAGLGATEAVAQASRVLLRIPFTRRIAARPSPHAGVLLAATAAVIIAGPYWRLDPDLRPAVARSARLAADEERAVRILSPALDRSAAPVAGDPGDSSGRPLVYVPTPVVPRVAVDLGLSTLEVVGLDTAHLDAALQDSPSGSFVFLSQGGDAPRAEWASLELAAPRKVGDVTVAPLLADPGSGVWVLRLSGPGAR